MSEPVNVNNRKQSYDNLDEKFGTTVKANEQMKPSRGARPDKESDLSLVPVCSVSLLDDEGSQKIVAELDGVATEENENAAVDISSELETNVTYPPVAKGRPTTALQVELNRTDSLQAEGRRKTRSQSRNEAAKMKVEALLQTKMPDAHGKASQPKLESWGSAEKKKENATRRQWTTVTFPAHDSGFRLNTKALFALIAFEDAGLVLSEEHTEQVAAKLGTYVTLQSFSCTGDDWYYKGPNETEIEIRICEGMECRNGWKEVINNTCNLDFNFTGKNAGIYRNKEYNKNMSKSYNVSGMPKEEQGIVTNIPEYNGSWTTRMPGYNDSWTYSDGGTMFKILTGISVSLLVVGIIAGIISYYVCKCYQRRRDSNGRQLDEGISLQPLNGLIGIRVERAQ